MQTKKFLTFGILLIVLVGVLVPTHAAYAGWFSSTIEGLIQNLFEAVASVLMAFSSLVLVLSGYLFDMVVNFTIIDMAKNINDPNGVGGSITLAWATLRDIANMCFIFVLLFAAFKAMFQLNFGGIGTTIRNIIIVALLINFSLFFSKVVIDASNIVAIGFYNSIASQSVTLPMIGEIKGISPGYMKMLGMQSLYGSKILDAETLDTGGILIFGILSSGLMLIAAAVLLMAGIMFITRFVILIFLMILSPLALIAYIIPGMKNQFEKWKSGLIDQSFFAPLFFALTWVVFKLGNSLITVLEKTGELSQISTAPKDVMPLIINYVLIIGFSIAALIIAKQMATRTAGFKMLAGGIGATALGGAGWAARRTIGEKARNIAADKGLQARVAAGTATVGERMKLATAQKMAGSSFDLRGVADTKLGKYVGAEAIMGVAGKASGVGGRKAVMEAKDTKRRKPIDDTMRQFRNKPDVLAGYLMRQKPEDQQYMYDKLGARDRAAINEELDKRGARGKRDPLKLLSEELMGDMSIEEREKTEKAGKDAAREAVNRTVRSQIENIISGRTIENNPATGVPYTLDDLMGGGTLPTGWRPLRSNETRKLSNDALRNVDVVKRLSARHLADLTSDKDDLDDTTKRFIVSTVTMAAPYPLMAEQDSYLNSTTTIKSCWGIP